MPDPNQQNSDPAIEAASPDPDREFAIDEWKSTQESIESFNDLGLRMRVFGIGGVFVVAGYGIQSVKDDRLLFPYVHSSVLIVLISLVLLCVVYFLDRHYYSSLLVAAVNYGQELERIIRKGKEVLDKNALEDMDKVDLPKGRRRNLPKGSKTNIWGKSSYISHYVSIVYPSLYITLDRMYFILAVLLLIAAAVLTIGLSRTAGSEFLPF
jgi:hypothetical protein